MTCRKPKYPDRPYVPFDDARQRLAALMEPQQAKQVVHDKWVPRGGWQLWRWDTLEDVLFD